MGQHEKDVILFEIGSLRTKYFVDAERCKQIEQTLYNHPTTADQMISMKDQIAERHRNYAILISRVEKMAEVYLEGGDWLAIHKDLRIMENVFANSSMVIDRKFLKLSTLVRSIGD